MIPKTGAGYATRMNKKRRRIRKPKIGRLIVIGLVIGVVILGGLSVTRGFFSGTQSALRDSDTAFSVPTHVGQPAPAFTATGVDGQPYTVTPGDGRPKALIFYMGYG